MESRGGLRRHDFNAFLQLKRVHAFNISGFLKTKRNLVETNSNLNLIFKTNAQPRAFECYFVSIHGRTRTMSQTCLNDKMKTAINCQRTHREHVKIDVFEMSKQTVWQLKHAYLPDWQMFMSGKNIRI